MTNNHEQTAADSPDFLSEQEPFMPITGEPMQEPAARAEELRPPSLRLSEVDRLREIIFGPHIEDYDRRFTVLRRDIDRMLSELRALQDQSATSDKGHTRRIEALEAGVQSLRDELNRENERQRIHESAIRKILTQVRQQELALQNFSKQFSESGKSLANLESDLRALNSALGEQRAAHDRAQQDLRREMRQVDDDLRNDIRQFIDRLDYQKTDRKALAAMLIEVATRLETGSSVTSLLEDLTFTSEE